MTGWDLARIVAALKAGDGLLGRPPAATSGHIVLVGDDGRWLSAEQDEEGRSGGGQAGDQTGVEVLWRAPYMRSKGWTRILRPPADPPVAAPLVSGSWTHRVRWASALNVRASAPSGGKLGTIDACFAQKRQHLGRGPAVEGRWLHRDQRQIGCKQRRAHQTSDTGRTINNDMIRVTRQFRRFPVQGIAGKSDDGEQPWQPFMAAPLRPVECGALRVGIDQDDALAFRGPGSGEMQRQRRLAHAAFLIEERDNHRRPPGLPRGSSGVLVDAGDPCFGGVSLPLWAPDLRAAPAFAMSFSTSRRRSSKLDSVLDSKLRAQFSLLLPKDRRCLGSR